MPITLAVFTLTTTPALAQSQGFRFTSIIVEGVQRVDAETVIGFAEIPRGETISSGQLNAAFQRLTNTGLFETIEFTPQGSTLTIRVQEFPTIARINIEGNERLDDEELLEIVSSQELRVYSPSQAETDARAITQAYADRGRLAATVRPRIIRRADNQIDLVFEVAEGRVTEIERISFVGNGAFSDRRLRRVLATKQAGILRRIIQRDTFIEERIGFDRQLLTDFYRSRGFIDFRVLGVNSEFARDREGFFITVNVQEGQRYQFGETTVSSELPEIDTDEYLAVSRVRRGQFYNPQTLDVTIARMERLSIQQGLNFVRARPVITRDNRNLILNVDFVIERGPRVFVERIDIEGNATTLDQVIRREFDVVEGDPFNPREIRASAERIRALGYFAEADVETREGTSEGQVIVDVDVVEQPTGSISFGGSFSSDTGVGISLGYTERNFLGRGQTLSFDITTGTESSSSSLAFIEPYFLGRDLQLGLRAFWRVSDFDEADYNTRIIGFSPSLSFPVSENGRLQVRYSISEDTIFDVDEGSPDNPLDNGSSPIIQGEEGSEITSSIGYTYSFDTRRTGLNPNAGVLLEFGQDLAGIGGNTQFLKTVGLATAQALVLNEEVTLRATIEGGYLASLSKDTRVTDRFFLSTNQLRGFESLGIGPRDTNATNDDPLGGNAFAVARLEAEFPLGIPEEYGISGGVFFDAGSVWSLDETSGAGGIDVDDGFAIRASIGFSVFWRSPLGPLRFNFAEAIAKESFDNTRFFSLSLATEF